MRHLSLLTLFICFFSSVAAQYSVVGRVLQADGDKPIEMATVRLFSLSGTDSTMVQGVQADMEGQFVLSGLQKGQYRLWLSSVGFQSRSVSVQVPVKDGGEVLLLPDVRLSEDVQLLSTVEVKGHAAEMTVNGDTIEYNTSAYRMQDGAVVEDLLKKMNGVQVDKEGNVTVNGESVKAVRIDGKKFFGSDVQSATKNIPAEMIDKIQVIDEKSDMAKLTGFEDDETERIINLNLKKDRKKGVFGNFGGGLGADLVTDNDRWFDYANRDFGATPSDRTQHFFENDFRYNTNVFTNILLGESQTTIIGNANNTNEIRTGRGRSAFGQQNQGITWYEGLGVNTNIDLTSKLKSKGPQVSFLFGGDGQLNHSYNDTRSNTEKESYSNGATYHNTDSTSQRSWTWDAKVRIELEYQIDSLNKLVIKPNWSLTDSRYSRYNEYLNTNSLDTAAWDTISQGWQKRYNMQRDINASLQAIYNHKFLKKGRSITVNAEAGVDDTRAEGSTHAFDLLNSADLVNQNTISKNTGYTYEAKLSYIEPLYGTNHLLEMVASAKVNRRQSAKDQYKGENQTELDSAYTNTFNNDFYSEALELNYRWVSQYIDLTAGVRVNPAQTRSRTTYLDRGVTRDTLINVWNFAPNFNFKYKFGKRQFARITYKGTTKQPTIAQLEPVRNNANAMNETVGNLSLNPAFQHTLRFMFSRFDQESFSSVMAGIRGTITKDALVSNSIYDENGKLYQQTVNARALPWNIGADLMFNLPFANKMLQLHSRSSVSYNQQIAYLSREQSSAAIAQLIEQNRWMLGDESRTGNLKVQENLNLRFTHDIVDIGIKGDFTYSRTKNNLIRSSLSHVFEWTVTGDVQFHLPKSWTLAADCGYTDRHGYNLSDVSELILNASVTKSWKNATLKLAFDDLLNNSKSIVQTVGDNYVKYQKFNTLPTYAMLTFTYKLNRMGSLKAKGKAAFMQEMMENGAERGTPGKGAPPIGPPPGM
ncbi:MAG: outer membrane beta-barrel protein [Paludibacteraceae bacterium]|nr:outer membrane beta-barrel protein [Paludibacteraceae bacterium]